jgi:hypothetical protein
MYDNCSAETGGLKRNSATIEDNQKKKARPLAAFQSAPSPSPYGKSKDLPKALRIYVKFKYE